LRPGGAFSFTMRDTEGQTYPYSNCFLEIEPQKRLVWSAMLGPGYRPGVPELRFTGELRLTPEGKATRYVDRAMHGDPAIKQKHEELGFHQRWGTVLEQLAEMAKAM